VAQSFDDPFQQAIPACNVGIALFTRGYVRQAVALFDKAIPPLAQLGDGYAWMQAFYGFSLAMFGRVPEGLARLEDACTRTRGLGYPPGLSIVLAQRATCRLFTADVDGSRMPKKSSH
jgi:hypothetical protein